MSLRKMDIIQSLLDSKLPLDCIYVVMGAALVLHGVKETTDDIDVGCSNSFFDSLLLQGYQKKYSRSMMPKIVFSDTITLYCDWKVSTLAIIEGIRVEGIYDIIEDKKRLGRAKDLQDIRLCENFLKERMLLI